MHARTFAGRSWTVAAILAACHGPVAAQSPVVKWIYTCMTGKSAQKSDHFVADCKGTQKRANAAGVVEWVLTADQEAAIQRCREKADAALAAWRSKDRSDKNLRTKYPDSASLRTARDTDLEPSRASVLRSQARLAELDKERRKLASEREFYPSAPMPQRLQRSIDDNAAYVAAQEQALRKAQEDITRIGTNFDELEKAMKKLWNTPSAPMPSADCSADALFGR